MHRWEIRSYFPWIEIRKTVCWRKRAELPLFFFLGHSYIVVCPQRGDVFFDAALPGRRYAICPRQRLSAFFVPPIMRRTATACHSLAGGCWRDGIPDHRPRALPALPFGAALQSCPALALRWNAAVARCGLPLQGTYAAYWPSCRLDCHTLPAQFSAAIVISM